MHRVISTAWLHDCVVCVLLLLAHTRSINNSSKPPPSTVAACNYYMFPLSLSLARLFYSHWWTWRWHLSNSSNDGRTAAAWVATGQGAERGTWCSRPTFTWHRGWLAGMWSKEEWNKKNTSWRWRTRAIGMQAHGSRGTESLAASTCVKSKQINCEQQSGSYAGSCLQARLYYRMPVLLRTL